MTRVAACAAVLAALLLAIGALPAAAQLSVETKEGWTFTFAGNVNAFYVFEREARGGQVATPGAIVGIGRQGSAVRSGYLPAFAVFGARRVEGPTTVGVHFGFAPQIQTTGGQDDSAGLGGRIDMRQVYLSAEGRWGQVLAGREIGVFARQNLLSDMSLFGTGATGGNFGNPGRGTVGRSGFGYIYPGFNAQLTYTTPSGRPLQLTVGIFDPSSNNGFDELLLPRLEGELTWSSGGTLLWSSALMQHQTDTALGQSATAWGGSAGARVRAGPIAVLASGYAGRGIGTSRLFRDGRTAAPASAGLRTLARISRPGHLEPRGPAADCRRELRREPARGRGRRARVRDPEPLGQRRRRRAAHPFPPHRRRGHPGLVRRHRSRHPRQRHDVGIRGPDALLLRL